MELVQKKASKKVRLTNSRCPDHLKSRVANPIKYETAIFHLSKEFNKLQKRSSVVDLHCRNVVKIWLRSASGKRGCTVQIFTSMKRKDTVILIHLPLP